MEEILARIALEVLVALAGIAATRLVNWLMSLTRTPAAVP